MISKRLGTRWTCLLLFALLAYSAAFIEVRGDWASMLHLYLFALPSWILGSALLMRKQWAPSRRLWIVSFVLVPTVAINSFFSARESAKVSLSAGGLIVDYGLTFLICATTAAIAVLFERGINRKLNSLEAAAESDEA